MAIRCRAAYTMTIDLVAGTPQVCLTEAIVAKQLLIFVLIASLAIAAGVSLPQARHASASGAAAAISSGGPACVLTPAGGVMCWGYNAFGDLGNGTTVSSTTPIGVSGLSTGIAQVSGGGDNACALTLAGGVKCWGNNAAGSLGIGTSSGPQTCTGGQACSTTPVNVSGLSSGVTSVSAGGTTCVVTSTGGVKCWGDNTNCELGNGNCTGPQLCFGGHPCSTLPANVTGLTSGITMVATGYGHACAVTTAGNAKCWGNNYFGQLGDGYTDGSAVPVDVCASGASAPCTAGNGNLLSGVIAVSAGGGATCALITGGGVNCWGNNADGELGNGTMTSSSTPVNVTGLTNGVLAISQAGSFSCALTSAAGVKCWGSNWPGTLGDGLPPAGPQSCSGNPCSTTPVDVTGLTSGIVSISAQPCALTVAGGVKCWGPIAGQGDGTWNGFPCYCQTTPVDVSAFPGKTPDFKQRDPTWNSDHLGGQTGCTIYAYGCAVTAVADVFVMYGALMLPNGYGPMNPGDLNRYLTHVGSMSGCNIIWCFAWQAGKGSVGKEHTYYSTSALSQREDAINTALTNNEFPVVEVHHLSCSNVNDKHYVVVTGGTSPDSYTILDPLPFASGVTLSSRYGVLCDVHIFDRATQTNGSPAQNMSWCVTGHSPIALLITDPQGRQTGYDPSSGTPVQDIPNSSYGLELGIADPDGVLPPLPPTLDFQQNDPIPGTYTIQVIGTGNGPYAVDVSMMDASGNISTQTHSGTASLGSLDQYQVQIAGTAVGGITSLTDAAQAQERRPADRSGGWPFAALAVVGVGSVAGAVWLARRRVGRTR